MSVLEPKSLRELTSDLARALDAAGRSEEALHTYRQARLEEGPTPGHAELYDALGNVSERLGDLADALDSYLLATIEDPARGTSAARALALLDDADVSPQRTLDLAAKAESPSTAAATHRLLGHVRRKAGDAEGGLAALRRARELADGPEESEIATDLVELLLDIGDAAGAEQELRSWDGVLPEDLVAEVLLAGGDFAGARARAARAGDLGRAVAMLAALGLGEADTIEVGQPTGATETVAAAVSVHLARAEYDDARKLLIEAEAVGVADSDDLALMRAQVLLEGAGGHEGQAVPAAFADVDEARRVLELVGSGAGDLAVPRWLRRQADVRGYDDRFRYAWAELLAGLACDQASVRAAVEDCPRQTTSLVQDAALDELLARRAVLPDEIASAWERAARAVDRAGHPARAWDHITQAEAAGSTPERRTALADLAWQTSYDLDRGRALDRLAHGMEVLGADSREFGPEAGTEAAYTHALLVSQKAQLAPLETPFAEIERAVPGVLAAMLAEDDRYRALYAANLLRMATLHKSAWYAARRCLDLAAEENGARVPSYAAEAGVIAEANYGGDPALLESLLEVLEKRPDDPSETDFLRAIRLHMALLNGDGWKVDRLLAESPPSGPTGGWERWDWLAALMLRDGVRSRSEELREIAKPEESPEWSIERTAAACRLLGDVASADAYTTQAAERGLRGRHEGPLLNDLVRGAPGAEEALAYLITSWQTPIDLLEWVNVSGPLLADAWPRVKTSVERLKTVARARLAELDDSPPPLEEELGLVPGAAGPHEVGKVLLRLLESERTASAVDVLAWADVLRGVAATGALKPALAAVADGVEQRVNARLGLDAPAPGPDTFLTPNPIAVELGAGIVDHVNPAKPEGEGFIADHVETMRRALRDERGVVVPGIRFRSAYVADNEIVVRIAELPVLRRRIQPEPSAVQRDVIEAVRDGISPYLARVVGLDAVQGLVAEWAEADADLVSRVLPDAAARVRLTWIIQAALHEGLSVADWRQLLDAVEQSGGTNRAMPTLVSAVTHALRAAQAPSEEETRQVPSEVVDAYADGADVTQAQHLLLRWLHDVVIVGRPVHLLAPDDLRDTVATLARTISPAAVTFARSEVSR